MTQEQDDKPISMLPLFYKKVVPLNQDTHKKMCMKAIDGYQQMRDTNSVYITATEFIAASREYPIVFAKDDASGQIFPVVLLGIEKDKNLFVDDQGQWQADYIPAYVRRWPFIVATQDKEDEINDDTVLTVCIDESYAGFNSTNEGEPLFDEKGQQSEILEKAIEFLKDYQVHVKLTKLFCDNLHELELLEPMQANVEMASGTKHALSGFMGVSRDKLKDLNADKMYDMFKTDQLELVHAHLASLNNMNTLLKRLN